LKFLPLWGTNVRHYAHKNFNRALLAHYVKQLDCKVRQPLYTLRTSFTSYVCFDAYIRVILVSAMLP